MYCSKLVCNQFTSNKIDPTVCDLVTLVNSLDQSKFAHCYSVLMLLISAAILTTCITFIIDAIILLFDYIVGMCFAIQVQKNVKPCLKFTSAYY